MDKIGKNSRLKSKIENRSLGDNAGRGEGRKRQ